MCFIPEELQEIAEPAPAEVESSSKNTQLRAKTEESSKQVKLLKKLKRSGMSELASENQLELETFTTGTPVSSSEKNKKSGAKNQCGLSDAAVSENGPLESSMLKVKSPPILAPLKTKLPPTLAWKPKKCSKNKHYLCSECGRELKSKSALEIHVRMHTDSRPFVCPTCGRGFRANGGLTRHQVLSIETLLSLLLFFSMQHT